MQISIEEDTVYEIVYESLSYKLRMMRLVNDNLAIQGRDNDISYETRKEREEIIKALKLIIRQYCSEEDEEYNKELE